MGTSPIGRILRETGLPLVPRLGEICGALEERGLAVVRSDPGTGKSTLLPLALVDHPASMNGRILMLEPRRAAAVGIGVRMADLLGEKIGERIGYSVRLERRLSPRTQVEVLTEGLLVRRLQGDPDLEGISTVIFDEFHERSVHTDLALALILDLRRMGRKVRLLIMSATMDAARIGAFIDSVENRTGADKTPVFDCPGRVFPVKIEYRPVSDRVPLGIACAQALLGVLETEKTGDVLVFLPGKGEIRAAARILEEALPGEGWQVLPLHGGLPLVKQREVIAPHTGPGKKLRRIILATNVAETGLTVPGITLVVDSGYARIERFHLPTGMNRLIREPISRQAADQRAGRAGRLMPGRCIRLWEESLPRPAETDREIGRIDLAGPVLESLLWGARGREELPWPDMPPESAWDRALELLRRLGAADGDRRATTRGREIARLGLHPRLGALCLAGQAAGQGGLAAVSAAILSERDGSGILEDADFRRRLALVRQAREGIGNTPWVTGILRTAGDLLKRLGSGAGDLSWNPGEEASVGDLLRAAFPDRIARLQGGRRFRFVSGREGTLEGPLGEAEWLVAVEVDAGERAARIALAAPLSPAGALAALAGEIRTHTAVSWQDLIPRTTVTRRAGKLVISEERRPGSREEILPELPVLLRDKGLGILPWDEGARRLLDRIRFFAASGGGEGPDAAQWTDEALSRTASDWLGPELWEGRDRGKGPVIDGTGLARALEARLGWKQKQDLDRRVPDFFILPNRKKRPLDYGSGEPVLRLRLQDAFGIGEEKRILGIPVVFHLLSPADRPIQITADLPGFWAGSYGGVRKELRGRYPKHFWPEDPGNLPERGTPQ
ncbi:ATP-dependent helicase HrpB [Treponema sp. TIM-1]|uniref:ATP-dependent helicase HrpB n=1 Tax=Treponema sp. TIM-1 TaxID=2898417 RepID=UPI00397F8746